MILIKLVSVSNNEDLRHPPDKVNNGVPNKNVLETCDTVEAVIGTPYSFNAFAHGEEA